MISRERKGKKMADKNKNNSGGSVGEGQVVGREWGEDNGLSEKMRQGEARIKEEIRRRREEADERSVRYFDERYEEQEREKQAERDAGIPTLMAYKREQFKKYKDEHGSCTG